MSQLQGGTEVLAISFATAGWQLVMGSAAIWTALFLLPASKALYRLCAYGISTKTADAGPLHKEDTLPSATLVPCSVLSWLPTWTRHAEGAPSAYFPDGLPSSRHQQPIAHSDVSSPGSAESIQHGISAATCAGSGLSTMDDSTSACVLEHHASAYTGSGSYHSHEVHAKLYDHTVGQLAPDFPAVYQRLATSCASGPFCVTRLSVRPGCLIISADFVGALLRPSRTSAAPDPEAVLRLLTRTLRQCDSDRVLSRGSLLQVQTAQGVICAAWDSAARQYVRIPSLDASRLPRLDWLRAQAQMCKVLGSGPVVYCLPLGPTAHSLRLVPRVQLPRHCYLRGWQPAGAEGGRSARVRAVSPAGPSQADSGLEVRVLARRHGGGYLPVSVRILTVDRAPEPQGTSCVLDLEVVVSVSLPSPEGLSVELWAKALPSSDSSEVSSQGVSDSGSSGEVLPELFCSDFPVLLLSEAWQAAAAELQRTTVTQHHGTAADSGTAAQAGANKMVLRDLGLWLSYQNQALDPSVQGYIESLHTSLLMHAVNHGMLELAQLLVAGVEESHADGGRANTPRPWLVRAARPAHSPASALLHAAMASGRPEMVTQVIQWVRLYGGQGWRWDWDAVDEMGCTPLHLVAGQTNVSTVTALLEALVRSLTPAEARVTHTAWLQAVGGVRSTPAAWFNSLHSRNANVDSIWAQAVSTTTSASASNATLRAVQQPTAGTHTSQARATGSQPGAAARPSARAGADGHEASLKAHEMTVPTVWRLVREAWRWGQSAAQEELIGIKAKSRVILVARLWVLIALAVCAHQVLAGAPQAVTATLLHVVPHAVVALGSTEQRWTWLQPKVWLRASFLFVCVACLLPHGDSSPLKGWFGLISVWKQLLICALPGSQVPFTHLAISHLASLCSHHVSLQGLQQGLRSRALLPTYILGLLVSLVVRVYALRASHYRTSVQGRQTDGTKAAYKTKAKAKHKKRKKGKTH